MRTYTYLAPQFGDEYVLGIERDDYDVERVVLYPLVKTGTPPDEASP